MPSFEAKFGYQEKVFILSEARRGLLRGGLVKQIIVDVGGDGTSFPTVFYKIDNNAVFAPAGGYYREWELVNEADAREEAASYHNAKQSFHSSRRDSFS